MSRKNALKPLSDRLSPGEQNRRIQRQAARMLSRDELSRRMTGHAYHYAAFLQRGFLARLKWVLFGEPAPQPVPQKQEAQ